MNKEYITVLELNTYLKNLLNTDPFLYSVNLKGEISNFKNHTRGHLYFTLKDDNSRINAVMFVSNASKLSFTPKDGMNVLVKGRISIYEATGNYQIYVESMIEDGVGNLYLEYEKLKKKLLEEGLFNESHKLSIPKYPKKIGIITAPTGAAIKDILSTIKRRYPICETILFPSLVQGPGASNNIVKQIEIANTYDIDTLIIGRGGGSIEDLWAFNEPIVAYAIYNSKIPIISAVGHEIDYTISDFVSDLRAPTPTGAAELAVPNLSDINNYIMQLNIRVNTSLKNLINNYKTKLKNITSSYILTNPLVMYEVKEQKLNNLINTANNVIQNKLIHANNNYQLLLNKLKLLNPLSILEKGYSVISINDKIITNSKDLEKDDKIKIKLHVGEITAIVNERK